MKRVLLPLAVSAGRTSCATAPARPSAGSVHERDGIMTTRTGDPGRRVAHGVIRQS